MKKASQKTKKQNPRFFTVGHSNHSISEFIEILQSQKLKLLIDVRKIPKSRHNPQFWGDRLAQSLAKHGIEYLYVEELGGRRRPRKDSKNGGWRNSSFKGYADHLQTEEFHRGLKRLISLSRRKKLVIMCAEAVPWRCHRRLIADALIVHGHQVIDLYTKTNAKPHELTPFAKVNKRQKSLTYPASSLTENS